MDRCIAFWGDDSALLCRELLTKGSEISRDLAVVLVADQLVLAEDVASDTLDDTGLGITLVLQLPQAEGEGSELLLDLGEDLARGGSLQTVGLVGAAVEGGTLIDGLDLAGAGADANLDTPDLTGLGDAITLGALSGSKDNLLGTLNLVAVEQPRGGALDNVDVIGAGHLLEQAGDLGLCRGLLGGGLGLLLLGALGQETRGDHQPQKKLVGIVGGQHQIGLAAGDGLASLLGGSGDDGVANNGTEAIDLGAELDLDGLAFLDLDTGLALIGGERGVGSDVGRRGDGGGVRKALGRVSDGGAIGAGEVAKTDPW